MAQHCDSCGRWRELFQLPGRTSRNCSDCNADIAKLASLYSRLQNEDPDGDQQTYLENQIVIVLERFLSRSGYELSVQFFVWPETKATKEHLH